MKPSPKALFISHGGGPLPLLGDPAHREMVSCLQSLAATISRPDALVVVSAHWEARIPALTSAASPSLIYDYSGFPPASYEIEYPCPGDPALAGKIRGMLDTAGIDADLDAARGLDHGVFVPLKIMYPEADIPCVQMSLVSTLDPALHIDIGRALAGLVPQNVLLIGSGFSFHNLHAFFAPEDAESARLNAAFEAWLTDVCSNRAHTEEARREMLVRWSEAPGARHCHPREEHLLPLHVCYGAAQGPTSARFDLTIMNKRASLYVW